MRQSRLSLIYGAAALAATFAFGPITAATPPPALTYAVRGARVFTAAGAPLDGATILMRNGVIEDVGASVTVPVDAVVIDGAGMNVYPGLIDMANSAPLEAGDAGGRGAAPPVAGRGGGRGGGDQQFATLEESERAKRATLLRPDFVAAENLVTTNPALAGLAAAGITTVLAVPESGIFKGQSSLVNVVLPPDDPQISAVADYRRGLAVVKSPVAMHVNPAGRGGGQGYPNSLLGTIAFTRQGFLDAQWQRDAATQYVRSGGRGPRPLIEPALDALRPALERQMPTAFDAVQAREIDRALGFASEFNLDPIIVGGQYALERADDLAKAKARVILNVNFGRGAGDGGGRGGGGAPSLRVLKDQAAMPKTPAALAQAGVPFAFSSGNASPADFVRNAARTIKDGGLPADAALRALTIDAARLAGAGDRVGSIEKGKIANIIVTQGDLFDGGTVRHVFIDGRPVQIETPAPAAPGRGGRGGGR